MKGGGERQTGVWRRFKMQSRLDLVECRFSSSGPSSATIFSAMLANWSRTRSIRGTSRLSLQTGSKSLKSKWAPRFVPCATAACTPVTHDAHTAAARARDTGYRRDNAGPVPWHLQAQLQRRRVHRLAHQSSGSARGLWILYMAG